MSSETDIPVLTDVLQRTAPPDAEAPVNDIDILQERICAASLRFAEDKLRDACREAEHVMIERVMTELRAELPAIVREALRDHLKK